MTLYSFYGCPCMRIVHEECSRIDLIRGTSGPRSRCAGLTAAQFTTIFVGETACRNCDNTVVILVICQDLTSTEGSAGGFSEQPCRRVNDFLLLLCILRLAAPHHFGLPEQGILTYIHFNDGASSKG